MRKSSKIFWIALVVVAMLVVTTLGAMAASGTTNAVIYGELVEGAEGAFSVNYKIKNVDKEVECGKITLNWDSESTEVVDVEYASILGTAEYKAGTGEAVIAWAGSEITEGDRLFTVKFTTEEKGIIPIETTVDSLGAVGSFAITYDCAEDVTANKVYASDEPVTDTKTLTVKDGDNIYDILEEALEFANLVDVIVDLKDTTWTIDEDRYVGDPDEVIPPKTITIQNGTITQVAISPRLSTAVAYTTVMYGHFVFDNITLGIDYTKTVEFGGFVFPDGCSGTFENITPGTVAPNLYGNVTVKSGTYCIISGGIYSEKEGFGAVVNNPVIVVEGTTTANRVVGGTFKTNVDESVTGRATVTVQGNASVTGVDGQLVAGAMFRKGDSVGADLTVDTTGTIKEIISSAVAYGITEEKMETFTTTIKNAIVTGGVYGYKFNNTESSYVDVTTTIEGGTFNCDVYGGADAPKAGVTLYGKTALDIKGGYFGTYGSKTTVYGGSNVTGAGFDHNADSTLTISGGRYYNGFFGGSKLDAQNAKHSGTSSVIVTKTPNTYVNNQYIGHIFGGSDIKDTLTGRVHSGASSVTIGTTDSRVNINLGIYGGSFIQRIGAHEGNSTVTINNAYINNASDGFYTYGGSSLGHVGYSCTGDVLHKGNSSVIINKATISGQNYVFGGSEVNTAGGNTKHIGNSNVTINGGEFGTSSIKLAGIFGGSKLVENSMHKGASTLTINGGTIYANIVLAGSYGSGTIDGDSTFTMTGGTISNANSKNEANKPIGAGSYGLNDLDADETSTALGMTGGIRQTGKLTFNLQGGIINQWIFVAGYKSNLQGDIEVNISAGTVGMHLNLIGRDNTTGITGDVMAYLTGGNIPNQLRGGENNIVGGNIYVECSGTNVGGKFSPAYVSTVNGKVYVKLIGDPTLPKDYFMKEDNKDNTSVLDLVHYTGTTTFTESQTIDNIIYPVVDISGITLTNTNVAPGQKLAELVPATLPASLTSGNVAYTYAEFTEFDGYTEYDNFVFYDTTYDENSTEVITEVAHDTNYVKFGVGNLKSAQKKLTNTFRLRGAGMFLDNSISLYYTLDTALVNNYTDFRVKVEYVAENGEIVKLDDLTLDVDENGNYKETDGRYRFYLGLYPKQMCESLTAVLYAVNSDGEEVYSAPVVYGAYNYGKNQFSKSTTSDAVKTLLIELFNYADEDQKFNGYRLDTLSSELAGFTENGVATYDTDKYGIADRKYNDILSTSYRTIESPKVAFKSASLKLEDTIDIYYYIAITNKDVSVDDLKIKFERLGDDDETVKSVWWYMPEEHEFVYDETKDRYQIRFEELISTQMSNRVLATVYIGDDAVSNTLSYSIESYVARNKIEAQDDIVKAIIKYGDAVKVVNPEA